MKSLTRVDAQGVPRLVQKLWLDTTSRVWTARLFDGRWRLFTVSALGVPLFRSPCPDGFFGKQTIRDGRRTDEIWPECYRDAERAIERLVLFGLREGVEL